MDVPARNAAFYVQSGGASAGTSMAVSAGPRAAAIPAETLDFDHLADGRKAQIRRLLLDQRVDVRIIQLCDGPTLPADQELSGMGAARVRAADEGIEGVEPVHQVCLDQEIEGSVYRGWCRSLPLAVEALKDIVGASRFMAVPYQLEDAAAEAGEAQATLAAHRFGSRDRGGDAIVVIVLGRGKSVDGGGLLHRCSDLSSNPDCTQWLSRVVPSLRPH